MTLCACGKYLPPGVQPCGWLNSSEHFQRAAAERSAKRVERFCETRIEPREVNGKRKYFVLIRDKI